GDRLRGPLLDFVVRRAVLLVLGLDRELFGQRRGSQRRNRQQRSARVNDAHGKLSVQGDSKRWQKVERLARQTQTIKSPLSWNAAAPPPRSLGTRRAPPADGSRGTPAAPLSCAARSSGRSRARTAGRTR